MMTRRALAGLVAAGAALGASGARAFQDGPGGHRPPPPPTGGSRRGDVAALRAFAEKTHPRGREAAADPKWREVWTALEADADRLGDGAFFVGLWRGLSWFRDGHTTVLPFEFAGGVPATFAGGGFGRALPLRVRAFHDGFFVTAAKEEALPLLGARVRSVNGVGDAELMRRLVAVFPGTEAWAFNWSWTLFNNAALLEGLGAAPSPEAPIRLQATAADGAAIAVTVRPRAGAETGHTALERTAAEREAWRTGAGGGNYVHLLPQSRALYVSIDDMNDVEGKTFEQLTREVLAAMERPAVQRVILDLRRNGGGNNFWGEPLRKALGRSRFNRPGGLYVMTGPATFSAAQNLANRLERETWALFAGEPTGSSPNHYGDAEMFRGEASGITAIVSTLPWFDSYPMDDRAAILPDLPQPSTFAAWRDGRDPALALVLAHDARGAGDDLSRERVFYYERDSQKAAWTPFWKA